MFAKAVIICIFVAAAAAITPGYLDGAYALGAQSEHTVRGFGGLSSVSKQQKAIHSPYSSSSKTDIRVTNDGYHGYAAPAYAQYSAPAYAHQYASPIAHHGYAAAPIAHGYSHAAPAYAHAGYASPAYAHPGFAAPHHGYAAPVAKVGALTYSPATAVAHHTFSGFGVNYGY